MFGCIYIFVVLAIFASYSATVAGARLPVAKAGSQTGVSRPSGGVNKAERVVEQTKTDPVLHHSNRNTKWPEQPLRVICEPVIKCMCKVVPEEFKTLEMKEACQFDGEIASDVCYSTDEAVCYLAWWEGNGGHTCEHLTKDCIPYMFYHLDWEVAGH